MNDEYISREAARTDAFCKGVSCQECPFYINSVTVGCRVDDFIKAIPAADVRPVKRGEWIRRCDSIFARCPNCGCEVMQLKSVVFRDEGRIDFCPNCGADIRGGADG